MNTHLKDALIRKVAAEEEDNEKAWSRTGKGAVIGGGLGALAGGSFLGGAALAEGGSPTETGVVSGVGAALGAGVGGTIGAIAPHVAVGLMAIMKKHQNTA